MTQIQPHTLQSPVRSFPTIGSARGRLLAKLGIQTIRDLLFLFPRDYEHPSPEVAIDRLKEGQAASVTGRITDAEIVSRSPGKSIFGAVVTNESGSVRMVFFNQPFRAETITLDRRVMISGAPKQRGLRMEFNHPKVRFLENDEEPGAGEILPVYPLTEGFKQVDLRRMTKTVVEQFVTEVTEVLPENLRIRIADTIRSADMELTAVPPEGPLPTIQEALRQIHFPTDDLSLAGARTRFVFQELFVMQLALAIRRRKLTTDLKAPILAPTPITHAKIIQRFAFELTHDQKGAIKEISRDMSRQFPMNRLLQGDVGSGKTAVALYAMMLADANGYQAVMMAPTEILARQHHATLNQWADDLGEAPALLCGSMPAAERRAVLSGVASGKTRLLVGTQALLHGIEFSNLGLCVIDEQHKFGVHQRTKLRSDRLDPHYLVMSATPIPRSMAMTIFGDVDLSTIREKPPGRTQVHTYLAQEQWKPRWWRFVSQKLDEGRQAYVVAPRVSNSNPESLASTGEPTDEWMTTGEEDISSVESIYASLSTGPLAQYRVALLHGRMPSEEKQAIMEAFHVGDVDVIVSTTVIEVGIDVPNATVMAILGANRFGLAQLHQLRGRVSRGVHPGHVAIFTDGEAPPQESERLRILESTDDGFELAEADFKLRGPGDLLGKRQSGLPPMRIADVTRDTELLVVARQLAQELVDADPLLESGDLALLRQQVLRRYGKRLEISDVA